MSARETLPSLIGMNYEPLSKEENILLEAELFLQVYDELTKNFKKEYREYFYFMRFTQEMENTMLETNFIQLIIKDILFTGEYTLQGIALYTGIHEDVLCELAAGLNDKPLAMYLLKMIALLITVRKDLYIKIRKKIIVNIEK